MSFFCTDSPDSNFACTCDKCTEKFMNRLKELEIKLEEKDALEAFKSKILKGDRITVLKSNQHKKLYVWR
jgi:hypothetical protein